MLRSWLESHLRMLEWGTLLIVVLGVGYAVWHTRGVYDAADLQDKLSEQKSKDSISCHQAQETTKEATDAIIKNLQGSNNQCATALRMRSVCVPVHQAGSSKLASTRSGYDNTGLESGWLKAYETECKSIQNDYHTCVKYSNECSSQ